MNNDMEMDPPAIRVGSLGSELNAEANRLLDLADGLLYVGFSELSHKLRNQAKRLMLMANDLQTCSNELVNEAVGTATQATANMFQAAMNASKLARQPQGEL